MVSIKDRWIERMEEAGKRKKCRKEKLGKEVHW